MSIIEYKISAAVVIFISSLIAALYPVYKHAKQVNETGLKFSVFFAVGVFLGIAIFHLLPDSVITFNKLFTGVPRSYPYFLCLLAIVVLFVLDYFSTKSTEHVKSKMMPFILTVMLLVHSLIEGSLLGVNLILTDIVIIFIAIILHKLFVAFSYALMLLQSKLSLKNIVLFIVLFALATPMGIIASTAVINHLATRGSELAIAVINALTAGMFLYIAITHHTEFKKDRGYFKRPELAMLALGLIATAVIS